MSSANDGYGRLFPDAAVEARPKSLTSMAYRQSDDSKRSNNNIRRS
jgi:hypothetical protein